MIITTDYSPKQKEKIVNDIFSMIKNEENLSFRKKSEIAKYLERRYIYLIFEDSTLIGFLFYEKLSAKLIELHGLYLKPEHRKKGYAGKVLDFATKDRSLSYLGATFLENIEKLTAYHGFRRISLSDLTLREKINFIKPRFKLHRLKEVRRHKKKHPLILIKKECL